MIALVGIASYPVSVRRLAISLSLLSAPNSRSDRLSPACRLAICSGSLRPARPEHFRLLSLPVLGTRVKRSQGDVPLIPWTAGELAVSRPASGATEPGQQKQSEAGRARARTGATRRVTSCSRNCRGIRSLRWSRSGRARCAAVRVAASADGRGARIDRHGPFAGAASDACFERRGAIGSAVAVRDAEPADAVRSRGACRAGWRRGHACDQLIAVCLGEALEEVDVGLDERVDRFHTASAGWEAV